MAQVITFENYLPSARYDATPWTEADIEESTTADGPWTLLETIALSPVDADPANPAYRDFTTELASDDEDLWYRIVFKDATGDESQATTPVQNSAASTFAAYSNVTELARILKIRAPSAAQTNAMERVLVAAAGEIRAEIDLAEDVTLSGWQLALAAEVNLERAAELWEREEIPHGIAGIGSEFGATHLSRNSWDKHAYTLAPLKNQWGIA